MVRENDNRINKIVNLVILVIGVYLIVNMISGIYRLEQGKARLQLAKNEVSELRERNNELKAKLEDVTSVDYKEKVVRDELALQKPGEQIVILEGNNEPKKAKIERLDEKNLPKNNVEKWLGLFFD